MGEITVSNEDRTLVGFASFFVQSCKNHVDILSCIQVKVNDHSAA